MIDQVGHTLYYKRCVGSILARGSSLPASQSICAGQARARALLMWSATHRLRRPGRSLRVNWIMKFQAQTRCQAAVESCEGRPWSRPNSTLSGRESLRWWMELREFAQVQIGNLVGPNSVLTQFHKWTPSKPTFRLANRRMSSYKDRCSAVSSKHNIGFFGNSLDLILERRQYPPSKRQILLADRQVDPSTGTIRIVAAFPNPGNILRPGQYGRGHVETNMKKALC